MRNTMHSTMNLQTAMSQCGRQLVNGVSYIITTLLHVATNQQLHMQLQLRNVATRALTFYWRGPHPNWLPSAVSKICKKKKKKKLYT